MRFRSTLPLLLFALAFGLSSAAISLPPADSDGRSEAYREATRALDEARWNEAAERFAAVAAAKGADADAALYWKAYAELKAGRRAEARLTVRALEGQYPESVWLDDAALLAIDPPRPPRPPVAPVAPVAPVPPVAPTPRAAPAPPAPPAPPTPPTPRARDAAAPRAHDELSEEEDLQLYALDGLMHMDAARAVPILQRLLASDKSLRVKQRALFVLGQSDSPNARQILVDTAKSGRPPGIQIEAVRALGIAGDRADVAALEEVYRAVASDEIRSAVLEAWMIAGEEDRILTAAKSEADAALRGKAVEMLGVLGATEELAALYGAPGAATNRAKILEALMIAGDEARLLELARREANPELRLKSIQMLGVMGATKDLAQLYDATADREQKSKIIEALMISGDGEGLVALLRKEKDRDLKREIVQKLTLLGDDAATDELLRLLEEKP